MKTKKLTQINSRMRLLQFLPSLSQSDNDHNKNDKKSKNLEEEIQRKSFFQKIPLSKGTHLILPSHLTQNIFFFKISFNCYYRFHTTLRTEQSREQIQKHSQLQFNWEDQQEYHLSGLGYYHYTLLLICAISKIRTCSHLC